MGHIVGAVFSLIAGGIAVGLALVSTGAARRAMDGRLYFVAAAFAMFGLNGLLVGINHWSHWLGHDAIEVTSTAMELAGIVLITVPFWPMWRR